MRVLSCDISGRPSGWISVEQAATLIISERVLWQMGETLTLRGGYQMQAGQRVRSKIEIPSILGTTGQAQRLEAFGRVRLSQPALFARDRRTCMYCGTQLADRQLTRDHVLPKSRGGGDAWENVVTACRRCNGKKADRTPEEASMPLLALPYAPNYAEALLMRNRRILADQADFLGNWVRDKRLLQERTH